VLRDLRTRLFAHLQRLPASYFDRVPIGDVISRCTADVETLDTVFSSGVALLLANLVRLVTIAVAMVALSPVLSLVAALIAAPLVLVTRTLQVRVRQAERKTRVAIGAVNTRLQEDLSGIEVIRAFGREPELVAGFRQVLGRGLAASNRSSFYSALYTPMTAIVSAIAMAALLAAATRQAFWATSISLGTLTAFLLLLQRFFQPITALGEEWQTVQGAMAGAERIFDTLALAPDELSGPERARTERGPSAGSVVLGNVDFGYAEGQPILHGLSLQVMSGEHVALVGRTGAGKTSAVHLIAGLYRPWAGRVLVAGHDPARLTEGERNRVLGVVPQVVLLFSGTVFDNLTLGDGSVADDAVYEAAAIAGADAFIRALPQGYRTLLSGGGSGPGAHLSAGQRQLVALARALVHRPAVVLLDEATAAIDNASDAAFRAALRERVLPRGSAVVTVAHRLTTALDADRVIVLDKGRIVEEGAPAILIARRGRFAALLELEAAGWDWRSRA
jgi:ATP-binding cassette subfamily B protein